jgi:hypothetical protein
MDDAKLLKSCPFCGRLPMTVKDVRRPEWSQHFCETNECPMNGRYVEHDAWNTRAPAAPTVATDDLADMCATEDYLNEEW